MKNSNTIIAIVVVIAVIVGGVIFLSNRGAGSTSSTTSSAASSSSNLSSESSTTSSSEDESTFTTTQLATFNGKSGNKCYVALSDVVYEVPSGTRGWSNGVHTESDGLAKCGMDLTSVIRSAPHGTSVTSDMIKIGTLI